MYNYLRSRVLFFVLFFNLCLHSAIAETECSRKTLIVNGSGPTKLGSIIDPPKNSDYSVWEPIVPQAVAIDQKGNVYIGDSVNYRVLKFDKNGNFVLKFPLQLAKREKKPELSHFIQDMTTDNDDNLYLINLLEYRVEKYSSQGKFLKIIDYYKDALNDVGKRKNNFQPSKVKVDKNGNVYLFNLIGTCVKKPSGGIYSPDGNLIKRGVCVSAEGKGLINYNEKEMTDYSGYFFFVKPIKSKSSDDTVEIVISDADGKTATRCNMDGDQNVFKMDRFNNLYTIDFETQNVIKLSPNLK